MINLQYFPKPWAARYQIFRDFPRESYRYREAYDLPRIREKVSKKHCEKYSTCKMSRFVDPVDFFVRVSTLRNEARNAIGDP